VTGRIFINYRRGDDQAAAGRLYDRLLQHFDREQLFMDVDAIDPGVDFVKSLDEQVAACIAFLAVIGPRWLNARNLGGQGPRRRRECHVRCLRSTHGSADRLHEPLHRCPFSGYRRLHPAD
jgi:hypothetical protein